MSGRLDAWERRERIRERKRREKEEQLKKQQQLEEKRNEKTEDSPYAWRELLKEKPRKNKLPPATPETSTARKYAKVESPIQKMLRTSPGSKTKIAPSTPIDSKWIARPKRRTVDSLKTERSSSRDKMKEDSPSKPSKAKISTSKSQPVKDSDDDDDDSDDDLLAYFQGTEAKATDKSSNDDEERKRSSLVEGQKSTRKRNRETTESNLSSDEEVERKTSASYKLSRRQDAKRKSRHRNSDLQSSNSEGESQRSNELLSTRKGRGGRAIAFSPEDEIEEYSEGSQLKSSWMKSGKKGNIKSNRSHAQKNDSSSEDKMEGRRLSSGRRGTRKDIVERSTSGSICSEGNTSEEEKAAGRESPSDSSGVDNTKKEIKPVLNPFTIAQQQQQSLESIAANCARRADKNDDDLWSDMEVDVDVDDNRADKSQTKTGKKRSRKSKSSKRDSHESCQSLESASTSHWSSGLTSPSSSNTGGVSSWYLRDNDDRYEIMKLLKKEDEKALKTIIHPNISNPVWEYEYEPLKLGNETDQVVTVPASLSRYLAPYQKEGIRFMYKCLSAKSGTIMGDEMGLGKTVQVIGLLSALFEKTGDGMDLLRIHRRNQLIMEQREKARYEEKTAILDGRIYKPKKLDTKSLDLPAWYPVLIIVPPSVVENWKNEFDRFSNFAVAVFSGSKSTRSSELDKIREGRAEVLVAAKSLFQDSENHAFKDLNEISWKLVVIDEFHTFKNEKGKLSSHLRELKSLHQPLVLGMTGTLMQNNHAELWNLIDLVQTNYLGRWKQFEVDTARAIKLGRYVRLLDGSPTKTKMSGHLQFSTATERQKGASRETIARGERKSKALEEHLSKIFIARKKEDVAADKLTKKTVKVVFCPPSEIQKRVYSHILTLPDVQHVKMASSPCDCGVNKAIFKRFCRLKHKAERVDFIRENQKQIMTRGECCYTLPINPRREEDGQPPIDPDAVIWRFLDGHDEAAESGCPRCPYCVLFPILDKLNKLSSHVGSLQADRSQSTAVKGSNDYVRFTKELEFAKVAFPSDVVAKIPGGLIRRDAVMNEHFELSGKMKVLHQRLKDYKKAGSKVLVFSYSTKTLDFIEKYAKSQSHKYLRIDGQVQSKLRQDLCNQFNQDRSYFLFLLSTKACGLGLNLTAANKVIIFDVEWNPSWDDQAQDRAYRIGQKNDVEVIRLVTEGTVDELKYLRQLYKVQLKNETLNSSTAKSKPSRLFRGVLGDRSRKGELFGTENLLKFKEDGSFLGDIWKSRGLGRKRNKSAADTMHDDEDIAASLRSHACDKLFDTDSASSTVAYMESKRKSNQFDDDDEEEKLCAPIEVREDQSEDKDRKKNPLSEHSEIQNQDGAHQLRSSNYGGKHDNDAVSERALHYQRDDSETKTVNLKHVKQQPEHGEVIGISEREDDPLANAVNQDALHDDEQGGALYEEGDEGYNEEMGGETQNAYASYENMSWSLPENPQDCTVYDDDDGDGDDDNEETDDMSERVQLQPQANMQQGRGASNEIVEERIEEVGEAEEKEEVAVVQNLGSRIPLQLRPEQADSSKEDFFRSRNARSRSDNDGDEIDGEHGIVNNSKMDSDDSEGYEEQSTKKKAVINLFGRTTTASKSNRKGGSGLYIPKYNKPRKKN